MNLRCRAIVALFSLAALAATPAAPPASLSDQAALGRKYSDDSAARLAVSVDQRSLDKASDTDGDRAKLLGYYLSRRVAHRDPRVKQILWMIEHHPDDAMSGSIYCGIDADDIDGVKRATAVWESAIKARPADTSINGNAATFFAAHNPDRAVELLNAAIDAEPKNPKWKVRLAELDEKLAVDHPSDAVKLSTAALSLRQSAYSVTKEPADRFAVLIKEPGDAIQSGDLMAAKRLASQLLETAELFKSDPAYGQAIHLGHIANGLVAVSAGKLELADDELAAAGKAKPSPGVAADGPDLSLAQELLNRGEKSAVRDYLDSLTTQWPTGERRLRGWIADIDDGKKPTLAK